MKNFLNGIITCKLHYKNWEQPFCEQCEKISEEQFKCWLTFYPEKCVNFLSKAKSIRLRLLIGFLWSIFQPNLRFNICSLSHHKNFSVKNFKTFWTILIVEYFSSFDFYKTKTAAVFDRFTKDPRTTTSSNKNVQRSNDLVNQNSGFLTCFSFIILMDRSWRLSLIPVSSFKRWLTTVNCTLEAAHAVNFVQNLKSINK